MEEIQKIIEQLEQKDHCYSWNGRWNLCRSVAEEALRQGKLKALKSTCFSMYLAIYNAKTVPRKLYTNLDKRILSGIMEQFNNISWDHIESHMIVSEEEKTYHRSLIRSYVHREEDIDISRYPQITKLWTRKLTEEMKDWKIEKLYLEDLRLEEKDVEIIGQWPVKKLSLEYVEGVEELWRVVPYLEKLQVTGTKNLSLPSVPLHSLVMNDVNLNEEACASLHKQKSLRRLTITSSEFPPSLLDNFDLPELEELWLSSNTSQWTVQQMKNILSCHHKFKILDIMRYEDKYQDCSELIPLICLCSELETLNLSKCSLRDEDIALISQHLKKLHTLCLWECDLGDASALHLKSLPLLRFLDLSDNNLTEKGLSYLNHIPNLILGNNDIYYY